MANSNGSGYFPASDHAPDMTKTETHVGLLLKTIMYTLCITDLEARAVFEAVEFQSQGSHAIHILGCNIPQTLQCLLLGAHSQPVTPYSPD